MSDYVYFMEEIGSGRIKIGRSVAPSKRQQQLQVGNSWELRLVNQLPNPDGTLERQIQVAFSHLWIRGEWFLFQGELKSWIDAGCDLMALPHVGVDGFTYKPGHKVNAKHVEAMARQLL